MSAAELIYACAESNDGDVWQEFVSRFHRPIYLSIIRTARQWGVQPQQIVDDLAQETYLKLCADRCRLLKALAIENPSAIKAYIKCVAINLARDHFKAQQARKRGSGAVAQLPEGSDPSLAPGRDGAPDMVEQGVLLKEIEDCLQACSNGFDGERDRLIFSLYYRQGLSAKAIADLPNINLTVKGVESAILRITRLIRERLVNQRLQSTSL
jgi:RNA polymerase sigma factor (sigma-70 family)